MKLPLLIKTTQQLRKILRRGDIETQTSWERSGPCPEFISAPAVEIVVQGQSYVVFMGREALKTFHKDMQEKDDARESKQSKR